MDKTGARECICNMAYTLKKLVHDIDSELVSNCTVDIRVLRGNMSSIEKLLGLDKGKEDKDES